MSKEQIDIFEDNPEYEAFVNKFKPKPTTDDCYTPPEIYEVVLAWAAEKYNIDRAKIVRPFYPGGDYESFDYPDGCTVLDNPPFSILTKICTFYLERGIKFFLFAPTTTAFGGWDNVMRTTHIITCCEIVYENGAVVPTSFVTNLGGCDVIAMTAPDLTKEVNAVSDRLRKQGKAQLPKYTYPDNIVTAAMLQRYSKYGVEFSVKRQDCMPIRQMEAQAKSKKAIYGGGLLLSERAAAEKAAAEKAAAERARAIKWQLSERELDMVRGMSNSAPRTD
ncbi:MAG: hypothetical protein LUD44_06610 [Firmicutes bacterium]|nr:hypothetical protein [Bacillota bacterium]